MAKIKFFHILVLTFMYGSILWSQENADSISFLKDSLEAITFDKIDKSTPAMVTPSILDNKPEIPKFNYNIKDRSFPFAAQEVEIKALSYQENSRWDFGKGFVQTLYGNANNPQISVGIHHQQRENYDIAFLGQYYALNQSPVSENLNYRYIDGRLKSHLITGENTTMELGMVTSFNRFTLWHPTSAIETGRQRNIFNQSVDLNFSNIEWAKKGWNWKVGLSTALVNISQKGGFEFDLNLYGTAQKTLSKNFNFNIELNSRNVFTNADTNSTVDIFNIKPILSYSNKKIKFKGGLHILAVTHKGFNIFPATELSYTLKKSGISFFIGTKQNQHHNTLGTCVTMNPYLASKSFLNTASWSNNAFTGIRIFNSSLALESNIGVTKSFNNLIFFQTEQLSEEFSIRYVDFNSINHGTSIQYFPLDFVSLNGSIDLIRYYPTSQLEAYNMPQADLKIGFDLKLLKQKLVISPNFQYLNIIRQTNYLPYGKNELFGIHAQISIKIYKNWQILVQGNNLLNSDFDRWNGYRYFERNFAMGISWMH